MQSSACDCAPSHARLLTYSRWSLETSAAALTDIWVGKVRLCTVAALCRQSQRGAGVLPALHLGDDALRCKNESALSQVSFH